jgi:hypothetical protein
MRNTLNLGSVDKKAEGTGQHRNQWKEKEKDQTCVLLLRSYFCLSAFILSTLWTCWQRLRTRQDKKSNQSRNYLLREENSKAAASQANAKSLVKLTDQKYLWDQEIFARSNSGTIPCGIQESIFFCRKVFWNIARKDKNI